jgi:tetratricopeptide (TPR) repeat protein
MQSLIIIVMIAVLSNCDLFKKKEIVIDIGKVSMSEMNQKIKQLLDDAARTTDDNEKAKLLGAASDLLMKKGDVKQAVDIARHSLVANPTQKLALCVIAEYSISHGQIKEALGFLEEAKRSDDKFARAYYLSGNAYFVKKDFKQAEDNYKKSIVLDPNGSFAYSNLAAMYFSLKQVDKALTTLQRLIDIQPDFAVNYKNAGIAAEKVGKTKEAKEYYEKYLTLNPEGNDKDLIKEWMAKL